MTISSPPLAQEHIAAGQLRPTDAARRGSLFSPLIDFLCLGGGSLLLFIPMLFLDVGAFEPTVAATTLFLAHFINSPHFAHSYQIFYRNFGEKAFGRAYSPELRIRYVVAGIVAPLALIAFFALAAASDSARVLGFGLNIMLFFVGWHYVKQGYGMIIVDSVLKKNFFAARDKAVLIVNSYLCWLLSWGFLNNAVAKRDMFGLSAYSLPVPDILLIFVGLVFADTLPSPARYETEIDFEAFSKSVLAKIPSGVGGVNWFYLNVTEMLFYNGPGYVNSAISGGYVAYNSSGHPVTISSEEGFDFVSAYFGVAWRKAEGEELLIEAWRNGELVGEEVIRLSTLGPVWFDAEYRDINEITMTTHHYWQFVTDDMVVRTKSKSRHQR